MSTFRRVIPILDSSREGKLWRRDRCHRPAACFSPNLNYAALLQKGAPSGSKAKSTSGCTPTLMKSIEALAVIPPLSLFLFIVLVLSVGIALHMAGPISIQTHPIEVPGIDIHIGTTAAPAEANQHKHAPARTDRSEACRAPRFHRP
jgi:hypothetical protein